MAKKMYVVFCEDYGTYWCGLNTWDNQLRKAKVFHSLKYANEVHERFKQLKLKNVEIRMELVPENPTNADRIRAMSDGELAVFLEEASWICDNQIFCRECPLYTGTKECKSVEEWIKQPVGVDNG